MSDMPQIDVESSPMQAFGAGSFALQAPGYGKASPATIKTYRAMRNNPTVALARAVAMAPIKSAEWSWQSHNDFDHSNIEAALSPLMPRLISDMCFGIDYGFKPFEKVWTYDERTGLLTYKKFKPLNVDNVEVIVEKTDGSFRGLKQGRLTLSSEYVFWYTYDREDDNWYGRSRMENIRTTSYRAWTELLEQQGRFVRKVAGITPMIEYPAGVSKDKDGRERNNFEIAQALLQQLGSGNGIAMPNSLANHAAELLKHGVPVDKLKAWVIQFLEASASYDFASAMRHHESGIMRGWLTPERTATEGQMGTKAESATHADISLLIAEETLREMAWQINKYIIDPLVMYNYGSQHVGSVYIEPQPLTDEKIGLMRQLISDALSGPSLAAWVDIEAMLQQLGLPVLESNERMDEPQEVDPEAIAASLARLINRAA